MTGKGRRESGRQKRAKSNSTESKTIPPPRPHMSNVAKDNHASGHVIQNNAPISGPTKFDNSITTNLKLGKNSVFIEAIHYHASYCSDVAYDMKRYAALVKEVDVQFTRVAKQAELTSVTISQLGKVFQEFTDEKGKMPRKRPLPKVEVLYGLIHKCANLLEGINNLIYHQVDAVVIPPTEGNERPEKRELSAQNLKLLKDEIQSAVTNLQLYTSNLEIQVTLFFGILHDQSHEEIYNMVAYLISCMKDTGQVLSDSKSLSQYSAGFHPRYTEWEIKGTKRTIKIVESGSSPPPGANYFWNSPAVQVPESDEYIFLHALALNAQYIKEGRTLKTVYDSLTPDQRNAVQKLLDEQNRLIEQETLQLEWHLAGIERNPLRSLSSRPESVSSLFLILRTGWKMQDEPDEPEYELEERVIVVDRRVQAEDEYSAFLNVEEARALPLPTGTQPVFVNSQAEAVKRSANTTHPAHVRMHARYVENYARTRARKKQRTTRVHRNEYQRRETETNQVEYQLLGPNLAVAYENMTVDQQNRHIDALIMEWDQVMKCLPLDKVQERHKLSRTKTGTRTSSSSWRRSADGMMLARTHSRLAILGFIAPNLVTISRGPNSRSEVILKLKK